MQGDEHPLSYTGQFWDDIANAVRYITFKLCNPQAAQKLKDDTESEIVRLSRLPLQLKPYFTDEVTGDVYYSVQVGSFMAFFVVIGETYEFRRFLYSSRNLPSAILKDPSIVCPKGTGTRR